MKSENETIEDWRRIDNQYVKDLCAIINKQEIDVQDYLADIVSSLCDIDTTEMMTKEDRLHCNHARWLYWYAYRYMTNDTFEHIEQITKRYGRRYSLQGISAAVNKMSNLIASNTIWTKRWIIIKRIIKLRDESLEDYITTSRHDWRNKIVITVPKEFKDKIIINYS